MIEYKVEDRIATITLNRPEKRNALNEAVVASLSEAFTRADVDPKVKVIVLKAKGKVFCAGADLEYLKQLQQNSFRDNLKDSHNLKSLLLRIYRHPKLVIAQVHGHAIAGGCGLASVCDFIFTVPEAGFGYTEVKIGFLPAIVMKFLLLRVGEGRTKELLLSGDWINADKAMEIGLVNRVVDPKVLEHEVNNFALNICNGNSAQSIRTIKEMIANMHGMNLEDALDYAVKKNTEARNTEDFQRGISAFLAKKPLVW